MSAKFIRASETVVLDVTVEINAERQAVVSGPGTVSFESTLLEWARNGDYFSTEFDIETEELSLQGCTRYSTESSGGFHVTFKRAL